MVDYKTGKPPNLKYNKATNTKIMDENFFQLKVPRKKKTWDTSPRRKRSHRAVAVSSTKSFESRV